MLDLGLLAGYIKKQWMDLRADSCWDEEVTHEFGKHSRS